MPYIPHSTADIEQMLSSIAIPEINALFDEIPDSLKVSSINIPNSLSELAVTRLMKAHAANNIPLINFAGAGAYEHHIPAAVWQIAGRGEFYSVYTPYQAEASQGTLQLLYEFQSMVCALLDMDCANASMYDGASATIEAILLAIRSWPNRPKRVIVPRTLHPRYRAALKSVLTIQKIEILELPFDVNTGKIQADSLMAYKDQAVAVIIPQPNYFGIIESVDSLVDAARAANLATIAVVNPLAMAMLKPPGAWGGSDDQNQRGVDIAVGEGQPLGIPLSFGGPYFGVMACKQSLLRQMPGRITGKTYDKEEREGYVLTLQTREQHIRRGKATSNICTNQGLMVTAATIHMAMLGSKGLYAQATQSHEHLMILNDALQHSDKVKPLFSGDHFHEMAIGVPGKAPDWIERGVDAGMLIGVSLAEDYPELGESLLICTTEMRSPEEIETLTQFLLS